MKIKQYNEPNTVYIWTDGSCNNNTKLNGGYGIVLKYKEHIKKTFGGQYIGSTSARMELRGAVEALKLITNKKFRVMLYCDNQYTVNSVAKGWLQNWEMQNWAGRTNKDLLQELLQEVRKFPESYVQFIWVKGHNGNLFNEICDHLASQGAKSKTIINDEQL